MSLEKYKQVFAIVGLLILLLAFHACGTATARPLDWSQSQKGALLLKYESRDALGVSEFYEIHNARQECRNLKQYGEDWVACIDWIIGGDK